MSVYVHPRHNKPKHSRYFDLAIIRIKRIDVNENVRTICLPEKATYANERKHDIAAFVIGWGALQIGGNASDLIHEAPVTIFQHGYV